MWRRRRLTAPGADSRGLRADRGRRRKPGRSRADQALLLPAPAAGDTRRRRRRLPRSRRARRPQGDGPAAVPQARRRHAGRGAPGPVMRARITDSGRRRTRMAGRLPALGGHLRAEGAHARPPPPARRQPRAVGAATCRESRRGRPRRAAPRTPCRDTARGCTPPPRPRPLRRLGVVPSRRPRALRPNVPRSWWVWIRRLGSLPASSPPIPAPPRRDGRGACRARSESVRVLFARPSSQLRSARGRAGGVWPSGSVGGVSCR